MDISKFSGTFSVVRKPRVGIGMLPPISVKSSFKLSNLWCEERTIERTKVSLEMSYKNILR